MVIGIQTRTGWVLRSIARVLAQYLEGSMSALASDTGSDTGHTESRLPVCVLSALHQTRSHRSRSNGTGKRSR